ncbi:ABC transporter permease subunit [Anaerococcus sp. WCA-380-WT-2B]|uniref:ABC transporter permease subunit n=1 Tax=Anaerococcus porci TaxID=2652269 RepID=A0A6N7VU29_9FIRM|nr:ABC transporter permease subunit [Anaerococcus porci]MSS78376.1 ABC transporter permease subunit [Anaerococcus porci]
MNNIPTLPLVDWIDNLVNWLRINVSFVFNPIRDFINFIVELFIRVFNIFPPLVFILLIIVLAFFLTKKVKGVTIFAPISLTLIWNLGYWEDMIITLSIVITSALIAIIIGIPLGILVSKSKVAEKIIMPLLDFMQTMPAFVYLIPAVSFFGIGMAPGVISSVIFAMPPAVRMTNLGIREVPNDLVEAADSFGSTPRQKLFELELPMAKPSIMAGINQTLMLTLSMVVVASMIGAPGLGNVIYTSVSRNDVGVGFASGIAVVILAVILDRLTQAFSKKNNRLK